jgi:hypothetical protein
MHFGARVILTSFLLISFGGASWSDDDDPPKPTQEQVLGNLLTAKAPGQAEPAQPPQPIHPLNKADRKALKDEHRVVSGSRWRALTPEQRDELMRNLRAANAEGAIFVIDVRTGDVYKFDPLPPTDDPNAKTDARLSDQYKVHIVDFDMRVDLVKLPVSVGQSDESQSDRRGRDFVVKGPPPKL